MVESLEHISSISSGVGWMHQVAGDVIPFHYASFRYGAAITGRQGQGMYIMEKSWPFKQTETMSEADEDGGCEVSQF